MIKEEEYFKELDLTLLIHHIKKINTLVKIEFLFLNPQLRNMFQIRKMLLTYTMKTLIKTFKIWIIMEDKFKRGSNKIDLSRKTNR